jgi:pimeloyl-ACP methyl ester carboxylesterase
MDYNIKEEEGFKFIESNEGAPVLMLLHGLFGALSNFAGIIKHFKNEYNVVVPILPIFEMPLKEVSVEGLVSYVESFVDYKGYENINILGNSLGGHIAQLYVMKCPTKIRSITLTGSSGLFESAMGTSFPKRGDYEYIKIKTESTFFRPEVATKELVDEIFDIVNDRNKAIRVLYTAKSAVRHNLADKLHKIYHPTLLIWGKQDTITPRFVGERFNELIANSNLVIVQDCGHAPMMEKPDEFNSILKEFLESLNG